MNGTMEDEQPRRPRLGKRSLSSKSNSRSSIKTTGSSLRNESMRSLKKQGSTSSRLSKRSKCSKASSSSSASGKKSLAPPSRRIDTGDDVEPFFPDRSPRPYLRMVNRGPSIRSFQRAESNASLSTATQELEFLFMKSCHTNCSHSTADSARSLLQFQQPDNNSCTTASPNRFVLLSPQRKGSPAGCKTSSRSPTTHLRQSPNRRSLLLRRHSSKTFRSNDTPPYLLRNTTQSSVRSEVLNDSRSLATGGGRASTATTRHRSSPGDLIVASSPYHRPDNPVAIHLRELQQKSDRTLSCRSLGSLTRSTTTQQQQMIWRCNPNELDEQEENAPTPPPPVALLVEHRDDLSTLCDSNSGQLAEATKKPKAATGTTTTRTVTTTTTTTTTTTITTTVNSDNQEQSAILAVASTATAMENLGGHERVSTLWQPRSFARYQRKGTW